MVTVREAATVMLVRDRPDLEVLVLRRTPDAVFGPGATVFPGGAVDPADAAAVEHVVGIDAANAGVEHGGAGGLVYRVAAVRECFEEAGVLLARRRTSGEVAVPRAEWRDALNAGHATFARVLAADDLVIDARDLRVFSHWLTPIGAPRRYDTWFFVAPAPEGHVAVHDDVELVESQWVRPAEALDAHRRGDVDLILPTMRSLQSLARFGTAGELLDALDRVPRDPSGRPLVVGEGAGERVVLPFDPNGPASGWTIPLPDLTVADETRLLVEGGV